MRDRTRLVIREQLRRLAKVNTVLDGCEVEEDHWLLEQQRIMHKLRMCFVEDRVGSSEPGRFSDGKLLEFQVPEGNKV
jgi:hypothetical protein